MNRLLGILPWILLGPFAASLVLLDPVLWKLLPSDLVPIPWLAESPFQALPVFLLLAFVATSLARWSRLAPDFAALSITLLLATSQLNGFGLGPLDSFDVVLGLVLLAWIARVGVAPERPIRLSFLFFATGALLVLTVAHMPVMSPVRWLVGLIGVIRIILISILVVDLLRDRDTLKRCLNALVLVAAASALIGILQFALAFSGVVYLTLIDPPASAFKPTPVGYVMRASAFCGTAQHFSSFLLYALPAALWRFSRGWSPLDALICVILFAGIVVAFNFAAIFGSMLVMAVFPLLRWPNAAIHILLAGLGLLMLSHFAGLLELIYSLSFGDAGISKGVDQRKTLFDLGLDHVWNSPWVGAGVDGFGSVDGNFWDRPVHNIFGQVASELGVLGLVLMIVILFVISLELVVQVVRSGPDRPMVAIALMMVVSGIVVSQAEPNLQQSNFWLVLAISQAIVRIDSPGFTQRDMPLEEG